MIEAHPHTTLMLTLTTLRRQHIFCLPDQLTGEILGVLDLMEQVATSSGDPTNDEPQDDDLSHLLVINLPLHLHE